MSDERVTRYVVVEVRNVDPLVEIPIEQQLRHAIYDEAARRGLHVSTVVVAGVDDLGAGVSRHPVRYEVLRAMFVELRSRRAHPHGRRRRDDG